MIQSTPLLGGSATGGSDPAAGRGHDQEDTWTAWLADIPRRVGTRLFLVCDDEAHWRGWAITRSWCGLARCYRDYRFDALPGSLQAGPPDAEQNGAR